MAAVTASVATGVYRPPGATGTTTLGGGAATAASSTVAVNFGTSTAQPGNTDTFLYYFIVPYLDAHVLSVPSWRYAYILWIVIAFIVFVWAMGHQLKRSAGSNALSALIRKVTVRRVAFGASATRAAPRGSNKTSWYTMTYGQLMAILAFTGVVMAVTFAGADYLSPTTCTWGGTCEVQVFNSGPPRSTYTRMAKRGLDDVESVAVPVATGSGYAQPVNPPESGARGPPLPMPASNPMPRIRVQRGKPRQKRSSETDHRLQPRASALALNPGGWAPFNDPLLAAPNFTIYRLMWTTSSRIGLIAYALLPLVVCLSLKMWPFAVFAIPWLTDYSYDKTAVMHRWFGRIVWVLSTAHTVTFAIQLAWDFDPYGRRILLVVWEYYRFNWGVVAYVALTLMVALSFNPLRKRYYELFYYSHCALVVVFLLGCIVHYEPLWGWATLAIALWGAERGSRLLVWLFINGFFGASPVGLWRFWSEREGRRAMASWKRASDSSLASHPNWDSSAYLPSSQHAVTGQAGHVAPRPDLAFASQQRREPSGGRPDHDCDASTLVGDGEGRKHFGPPQRQSLYSYGFADRLPATPYLAEYEPRGQYNSPADFYSPSEVRLTGAGADTPAVPFHVSLEQGNRDVFHPPAGFAYIQLLPGRTLRLTIRTPRRIRWRSGQNVLLNIPSVTWWQTHPYTIINTDPGQPLEGGGSELVLLMRARRGFTKALFDRATLERRELEARLGSAASKRANGVLMRAMLSHPMGSAGRNRWEWYSTVVIVCGGSGVAFGLGVLEELCSRMANLGAKGGRRNKTTRVRFVWIIREYAHLAWVASALRRCMESVSPAQLRVDLHVTAPSPSRPPPHRPRRPSLSALEKGSEALTPPTAPFAKMEPWTGGSVPASPYESEDEGLQTPTAEFYDLYSRDASSADIDTDLTEFDGEVRHQTATEMEVSAHVRQEGRLRRALSRKGRKHHSREGMDDRGLRPDARPTRNDSFGDLARDDAHSLGAGSRTALISAHKEAPAYQEDVGTYMDITDNERHDLDAVAELARSGKPHLGEILDEEIAHSSGETMVAACGPLTLNTLVRRLVADRIGARKPGLDVYTEDFTY